MNGHFVRQEFECGEDASANLSRRDVPPFVPDAQSRQTETGCRDTRNDSFVTPFIEPPRVAAILHQARARVSLFPKEQKVRSFQVFQELVIFAG